MDSHFEQARALFLEGVGLYEAGQLAPAEQKFAAALALAPGRPSVLTNLGAVRLKLGRVEDALVVLEEAVAAEPGNAEALGHGGTALAELGRTREALAWFDRALAIDPRPAALWILRGTALREAGRREEAAAAYREALARGGDPGLLGYYLAGLEGGAAPVAAPREYVEGLFDAYAAGFDQHLVQALRYDAPRVLAQRLAGQGRRFRRALDLGCGTGLCGPLLRPLAERLVGVDLSANMLRKAQALKAYDELRHGDVAEFLAACDESFDLVVAADVFVYVGALAAVFRSLAQRVPPGGVFCFTVEESREQELVLRASLRYAHSEAGIRRLARENGFAVTAMERRAVRQEERQAIAGLFFWLTRNP
jgi:predicted TPR repeat methyltransferase